MQRVSKKAPKPGVQSIANFFFKTPKKAEETPERKRKLSSSSSSDNEVPESPQIRKGRELKKSRKDEAAKSPTAKKPALSKLKKSPLKAVDPTTFFGGATVRVEAKKPPKPKDTAVIELEDEDIDKSLMDVELDEGILAASSTTAQSNGKKSPKETKSDEKPRSKAASERSDVVHDVVDVSASARKKSPQKESPKKPKAKAEPQKKTAKAGASPRVKKEAHSDLDSSMLTDEERHERKRWCMMNYQKFKNRPSCLNPGSKEVPKGAPNCLAGLNFLITGVLESLERSEADAIIEEYGGKAMKTLSKKLNYLIAGEEAGPSKLAKAEEYGIPILTVDQFFDLIREKSGDKVKVKQEKPKEKSPKIANKATENGGQVIVKKEKLSPTKKEVKQEKDVVVKKEQHTSDDRVKKEQQTTDVSVKKEQQTSDVGVKKEAPMSTDFPARAPVPEDMMAWVDKYKPTTVKEIIGQTGAASNVVKLTNWLSKWYTNHDGKTKVKKPNPWAKNDDGGFYKAALLSGPPGIGKTTTATLVCKELGFDTVEFNASDTRSKRLLKEEVSELLSNKSLYGFCHGNSQALTKKHVLIMDEVDGMAGNEDRGGIQELIALIKDSSVPIICMCNDRNHQKMRALVNYCYDLRFNRPQLMQIKARILSICCKEKFKLEPGKVEEIIAATNNDIRQSINHISLLSAGKELNLKSAKASSDQKTAQKDMKMGAWDVVRKVFSVEDHKTMSFNDKCDLFFHDYSLGPLFVQHNYLRVSPAGPKSEVMSKVAQTADALSLGDLVEKRIRSKSAWSLLPAQAIFSSVMPGHYMRGHFTGRIDFPGWLGKNSRTNKRCRLAQEIHDHTRLRTSGSRLSIRMDYAPFLLSQIVVPMRDKGADGVRESLNVLKEYHLLREDIESLIELTTWPGKKSIMEAVNGRVKAALTRSYNKEVLDYTYSTPAGIKKKKGAAKGEEQAADVEAVEEEEDENAEMASYEDY